MKALTLVTAFAALSAPALAGGPTVVEADPMPEAMAAPVAAHDWSGFYAGLSYGRTASSEIVDTTIGPIYQLSKGSVSGLHLGYLAQRNQFVFGGELSYMRYNDVIMAGLAGYHMDRTVDLKGRLGVAANKALFYGAFGYSTGTFTVDALSASYKPKGTSYGLGMEYAATERLTIGVEYLARKMQADGPTVFASDIDVNLNTVSLRVGLSF
jgi:outer membrane immunogenic protein